MLRLLSTLLSTAAIFFALAVAASAQSVCPYIAYGAVLTAAQWNACFSAKQDLLGYVPVNKAGDVMLGKLTTTASTPTNAGFSLPQGSAPTNPNNGDVWTTLSGMFVRINGLTVGPLAGGATLPLANGDIYVGNVSNIATGVAPSGDLSMTNTGVFTIGANVVTDAKLAQMAAVTLKGNPTNALANAQDFTIAGLTAQPTPDASLDYLLLWDHTAGTFKKVNPSALSSASGGITALTGDGVATGPGSAALTLATVNSNVGSFGTATQSAQVTVNGKGLVTAAANVTITPAIGSVTGLGTGVATALADNVGSAGAFVVNGGVLGTPSSGVATNLTGTAAGLTAGNVTTNANLTGVITSVGNATSIASQTGTGTKFVVDTNPTIAGLTVTGSLTATGLVTNADLAGSIAASKFVGTDIATVGTLTAGTASTGFTINAGSVTLSGQFPGSGVVPVANASGSPSATFGVMKADGTTIQCTSGTCSAVGGIATAITVGTTSVNSASGSNQLLTTGTVVGGSGTLANVASTAVVFGTGTLSLSGNLTTSGAFNPTFAIGASVTYTFPGSAANLAALNLTDQTLSGGANVTSYSIGTVTSGTTTVDCGKSPLQYMTNGGASTIAAPSNDGSCVIQLTNNGSAGAITFSGFTVGSNTGASLDTTSTHKFMIQIARVNGSSIYGIVAQQ